jgi:hypothetical protein
MLHQRFHFLFSKNHYNHLVTHPLFLYRAAMISKRFFLSLVTLIAFSTYASAATPLPTSTIGNALKETLTLAAQRVTSTLGKENGFNLDPKAHIPLPASLQKVDRALTMIGMGHMTDDLELRMNRAAEAAMPKAKTLFINAIKNMTITDAQTILNGPPDAATQYLRKTMSPDLTRELTPLIDTTLAQSGAMKSYDQVMGQYNKIPFVSGFKSNLTQYAVDKTMDGIFYYVAKEEASIRTNPTQYGTDLLKKVFSTVK